MQGQKLAFNFAPSVHCDAAGATCNPDAVEDPVNPEHAKAVAEAMLSLWQGELPATVRVLSAVRDEQRNYQPDPKSRSAWQLATHIAIADVWFIDAITQGAFAFDPVAAQEAEGKFRDVAEVVAFYDRSVPAKLRELLSLDGDTLSASLDFFGIMQMPRALWIGFATHHSVHHRGQLSAYLRALGSKVPDIYGASADAEPVPGGR